MRLPTAFVSHFALEFNDVVALGLLRWRHSAVAQGAETAVGPLAHCARWGRRSCHPMARRIAYSGYMRDRPPPIRPTLIRTWPRRNRRVGGEKDSGDRPLWFAGWQWFGVRGVRVAKVEGVIARTGTALRSLLSLPGGTNSPLPGTGKNATGSPMANQIALSSPTPDREQRKPPAIPWSLTRYLYKHDVGRKTGSTTTAAAHFCGGRDREVRQLSTRQYSTSSSIDGRRRQGDSFARIREANQDDVFQL